MPEGEEQEQEIENLFEKIMKENFPSLAMEINFSESPRQLRSREEHTKVHIISILPKIKGKDRILKAAREKETQVFP